MGELSPFNNSKFRLGNGFLEVVDETLSFAEWEEFGKGLVLIHNLSPLWIGDWLCEGDRRWGEMYAQAEAITGLSVDTLSHYKYVASSVPKENRIVGLKLSHYRAVAKMPVGEQKEVLEDAAKDKLTVAELKLKIAVETKLLACGYCGKPAELLRFMRLCMPCIDYLKRNPNG